MFINIILYWAGRRAGAEEGAGDRAPVARHVNLPIHFSRPSPSASLL